MKYVTLWSGDWQGGSITVPNISKYGLLVIETNYGRAVTHCAAEINGIVGNSAETYIQVGHFRFALSGDVLTWDWARALRFNAGSTITAMRTDVGVFRILGVTNS